MKKYGCNLKLRKENFNMQMNKELNFINKELNNKALTFFNRP